MQVEMGPKRGTSRRPEVCESLGYSNIGRKEERDDSYGSYGSYIEDYLHPKGERNKILP